MRAAVLLLVFWSAPVFAAPLPYFTPDDFTPVWPEDLTPRTELARMPEFRARDQRARTVTRADFAGKIAVVNFFYASCGSVCPMLMDKMRRVHTELATIEDLEMASFTITPALDTPEKLADYARKRRLPAERWSLLTGADAEVRKLERIFKANKDVPSKREGEAVHSENVYLLDREGRIRGIYNASSAADLKLLAQDARALR